MHYYEFAENIIKPKKPLTPDQARIQGMKNQVKNTQKAIKAEKVLRNIRTDQKPLPDIS